MHFLKHNQMHIHIEYPITGRILEGVQCNAMPYLKHFPGPTIINVRATFLVIQTIIHVIALSWMVDIQKVSPTDNCLIFSC